MKNHEKCSECGGSYTTYRRDKYTCGPTCKKRRQRRLAAEAREIPESLAQIRYQCTRIYRHLIATGRAHVNGKHARPLFDLEDALQDFEEACGLPIDADWSVVQATKGDAGICPR